MAHHQHHGADYDAHVSRTLQKRPAASPHALPAISEDELAAEVDEPPETNQSAFAKAAPRPRQPLRGESLLTKAFHTDSESHEEEFVLKSIITHNLSVSSTCSNFSGRSAGDFTSDDGLTSPGTRASTPSSPRYVPFHAKHPETIQTSIPKPTDVREQSGTSKVSQPTAVLTTAEPSVEAQLGRKRCISFMCSRTDSPTDNRKPVTERVEYITAAEPPKRPCKIKFLCPSRAPASPKSPTKLSVQQRNIRLHSPAPVATSNSASRASKRGHRDSDVTIKSDSPTASAELAPTMARTRRFSENLPTTEATRFHEFATSDEETEDWMQQSTCHRSRLTVTDTLKKENQIRQLAEEVEEEVLEEEEDDDDDDDDDDADDSKSDFLSEFDEDDGFQTDDEEGFAESDDESDPDSDYEWWAPRRSPTASPFIPPDFFRLSAHRTASDSSLDLSGDNGISPSNTRRRSQSKSHNKTRPVAIRFSTPELPDSTDFVCGTLDEDRPIEQAYISRILERKAARHRAVPQDIDPTFPTSDPEIGEEDEEGDILEDEVDDKVTESDHPGFPFHHGRFNVDDDGSHGRKPSITRTASNTQHKKSPDHSQRRFRSPPPPTHIKRARSPPLIATIRRGRSPPAPATIKRGRSPALRGMFNGSPMGRRSPPPPFRPTSPPPSRSGSVLALSPAPINMLSSGQGMLGQRNYELTHTASLPRSPHPFSRRRKSSATTTIQDGDNIAGASNDVVDEEHNADMPYFRGAIDIVQGLECKRLKRREKLYRQYWKREEKRKSRRPVPGKGAERMRQVGIECAVYRGKRIMSI